VPINRAPFNSLVDDDGSNTTGTLWDKAAIQYALLDPMDAALATSTITVLATSSGVNYSTGVASLGNVLMPPLLVTDTVRAIIMLTQGGTAGGQLSLDAQGIGFLIRLDDMNGGSLTSATPIGMWDVLLHPELTSAQGLRALGQGGVMAAGASATGAPGMRMTYVQPAGLNWQVGGWTLSLDSFSQAAGAQQVWAWTVIKF
jgi:hypothetical protein